MKTYDINVKRRGEGWRLIVSEFIDGQNSRAYVSPLGDELDTYQQAVKFGHIVKREMQESR